jgi:hypothetical protein
MRISSRFFRGVPQRWRGFGLFQVMRMIWDQVVNWLIVPGAVVLLCGLGCIWMSRAGWFLSARQRAVLRQPWQL